MMINVFVVVLQYTLNAHMSEYLPYVSAVAVTEWKVGYWVLNTIPSSVKVHTYVCDIILR